MTGTDWILLDTETSGLLLPIYCVELAAQRMRGVTPFGEPFRALLNHDVAIDPMAESIHGYSRDYLRRHGREPREVHTAFAAYAGRLPVVAFNLSFDWARVLTPELARLGLAADYFPGFCALTLARRCIHETAGHGLQRLRAHFFPYHRGRAHRAADDVEVTARLMAEILWPRLERAGMRTFTEVAAFSRATPVNACLRRLRSLAAGGEAFLERTSHRGSSELLTAELLGFLRGLTAARVLTMSEVGALRGWLAERRGLNSGLAMRSRGLVEIAFGSDHLSEPELEQLRARLALLVEEATQPTTIPSTDSRM